MPSSSVHFWWFISISKSDREPQIFPKDEGYISCNIFSKQKMCHVSRLLDWPPTAVPMFCLVLLTSVARDKFIDLAPERQSDVPEAKA